MLSVNNLSVVYPTKTLFKDVNLKFVDDNCYGVIGANGAGKSTLLNILTGEIEPTTGEVTLGKNERLSFLKQDHFAYDEVKIVDVVLMGYSELYDLIKQREELYAKSDFSEEDGYLAAKLEEQFANMNGWEAESEALKLLHGLGVKYDSPDQLLKELTDGNKVKVLLAQALFGNPDVLILDEPTNHLDFHAKQWLENFIVNFDKTTIVVSHDRHFLNHVCTNIIDIDYESAKMYIGNYDFWRESSELARTMLKEQNAKKEDQIKQLEAFVARFSANASKSKQATSRKRQLEKITLDDIKPSNRRYPYLALAINRDLGKDVFSVSNLNHQIEEDCQLVDVNFTINGEDKVVFLANDERMVSSMLEILAGEIAPDSGEVKTGITVESTYFPKDFSPYFKEGNVNLVEWLAQYSADEQGEAFIRGFLGKMLFSGEEPLKKVKNLSGGEKMRMMFSRLMLMEANTLILDQPTNHLDLESIQSVNEALVKFPGSVIFASHDFSFVDSIANKIIVLLPTGCYEYKGNFTEFLNDEKVQQHLSSFYETK